ncbi:hypothetical protein B0A50_07908 [Salinomyces thailandicus]|uniref:Uncharacterized protein n=1 Tax=Salinomyces thailandicus TaxID=706561 RepID=A0A4U0TL06_9PEZI|nr:hypothetical protein B0A50_07908 [Salinomyces thailandica]
MDFPLTLYLSNPPIKLLAPAPLSSPSSPSTSSTPNLSKPTYTTFLQSISTTINSYTKQTLDNNNNHAPPPPPPATTTPTSCVLCTLNHSHARTTRATGQSEAPPSNQRQRRRRFADSRSLANGIAQTARGGAADARGSGIGELLLC